MDTFACFTFFTTLLVTFVKGDSVSGCPDPDPNCHPIDIVYDAAHCRYCRTSNGFMGSGSSGSSSSWSSGSGSGNGGGSGSSSWDNSFGTGDWATAVNSEKDAFSGSSFPGSGFSDSGYSFSSSSGNSLSGNGFSSGSSSNSGSGHTETTKYVIIEKQPEPSYTENIYPDIHPGISLLPNAPSSFPGSGSPFSAPSRMGPSAPSGMGPGSIPSIPSGSMSSGSSSYTTSSSYGRIVQVPLLAPGVPKYCVRGKILSCPSTCERVDEWGCKSCPCAPARFQTMPVLMGGTDTYTTECAATKLCARVCKNGYTLGDVGHDGCRTCSCKQTDASSHKEPSCPETLKCMLKCKDGYFLGDKQPNGCPFCRCLSAKESASHSSGSSHSNNGQNPHNGHHMQGQTNDNSGGSSLWTGRGNGNSMGNGWTGSGTMTMPGTGSNNILQSNNGVGNGKCEPPMCLDPNMSEKDTMELGKASANGGLTGAGMGGGMSPGGGSGGPDSDGCKPPMCFGGGQTMGSLTGNYGGGSSGSSGGCSGPFCASGNGMGMGGGMGGGMGSGSGAGGSGMPFSPFSSALSGGGPSLSGNSGGSGMTTGGSSSGSVGASSAVKSAAYNTDCFGPECSAKNGRKQTNCPGLFHCLVTCDGKYTLGPLDSAGCQTCSCS